MHQEKRVVCHSYGTFSGSCAVHLARIFIAGGEEEQSGLRTALTTVLAGVGLLGVLGVVINVISGNGLKMQA